MPDKRMEIARARPEAARLFSVARRLAAVIALGVLFCLALLPAYAHDEDAKPGLPSAQSQETAGRMTIAALALMAGVGVYYGVQRNALLNGSKHPPEWQKKMDRNAILLAIGAVLAVLGVSYALSLSGRKASHVRAVGAPRSQIALCDERKSDELL